jgi:hypothetical protein
VPSERVQSSVVIAFVSDPSRKFVATTPGAAKSEELVSELKRYRLPAAISVAITDAKTAIFRRLFMNLLIEYILYP